MSSLRELGKASRRARILDAAERLILKHGSVDFPVTQIAREAGVSPATPYNLFGSREIILFSVCDRLVSKFSLRNAALGALGPLDQILEITNYLAFHFISNGELFRLLYKFAASANDEAYSSAYDAHYHSKWVKALSRPEMQDLLLPFIETNLLAHQLMISMNGAVERWAHNVIGDQQMRAQALFGAALTLRGAVNDAAQQKLETVLEQYSHSALPQTKHRC